MREIINSLLPFLVLTLILILILGKWVLKGYKEKSIEIAEAKKAEERLKEEAKIKILKEKNEEKKALELKQRIDETLKIYKSNDNQKILLNAHDDFGKLLEKNQDLIIQIKREYIQDFVKISNFLKTKKKNIEIIFNSIKQSRNFDELERLNNHIKNQINTYNTILFHSLNMVTSIVKNNMIVFYEIYEQFDKLGIFNSNWEKNVSQKINNLADKLDSITNEISELNYMTQDSFNNLNQQVASQLESIDSSIKFNNLLTGIQLYQLNKTKGIQTKKLN